MRKDLDQSQFLAGEDFFSQSQADLPVTRGFGQLRSLMHEYVRQLSSDAHSDPGGFSAQKVRREMLSGMISVLQIQGGLASRRDLNRQEAVVHGGVAISPYAALSCADDYERTDKFLYGLVDAICHRMAFHPGEKVKVLEAGVGPLGLLVFPVASAFSPQEVEFSVVDVHESSLASFRQIAEKLGMGSYLGKVICGDAALVDFSKELRHSPDIIVSEVMDAGLQEEPQIAVTRNLQRFLKPGGIFLPEKISLKGKVAVDDRTVADGDYFQLTTQTARDIHQVLGAHYDDNTGMLKLERMLPFSESFDTDRFRRGAFVLSTSVQVFDDITIAPMRSFITEVVRHDIAFPKHSTPTSITVSTVHGTPQSRGKFSYRIR